MTSLEERLFASCVMKQDIPERFPEIFEIREEGMLVV